MAYSKQNFQDGQILNAANLEAMENGIIAGQGAKNLLVNSNFRNPINTNGQTSYTGAVEGIDKWVGGTSDSKVYINTAKSVAFYTNTVGNLAYFRQYINIPASHLYGKTFTLALEDAYGTIFVGTGTYLTENPSSTKSIIWITMAADRTFVLYMKTDGNAFVQLSTKDNTTTIRWAALYEGSYTSDTLPPYIPKDKRIEMLNCDVSLAPHNLLDNSDFINAINYSGATSWTAHGVYCIDRWKTESANNAANISYTKGSGITLTPSSKNYAGIIQQFENYSSMTGKVYTIAVCINNVWYSGTFTMGATPSSGVVLSNGIRIYSASGYNVLIRNPAGQSAITIQRAALYEGSYDASTLPPYAPKGKHVEMLNCNVPLAPRNLLDNSDFRNPVNQRGKSSYSGTVYGLDRWKGYSTQQSVLVRSIDTTVSATGTSYIGITQKVENMSKLAGKTITFAVKVWSSVVPCIRFIDAERISLKNVDGTAQVYQTLVLTYTVPSDATSDSVIPTILCRSTASGDYIRIYWAALYEGSYTADTLPAYVPKGYAAELAECLMFHRENVVVPVSKIKDAIFLIGTAIQMRDMGGLKPTITLKKFTRPGVIDVTSFNANDIIDIENLGGGRYLLMNAILVSCMDYASGYLRFSVNADI